MSTETTTTKLDRVLAEEINPADGYFARISTPQPYPKEAIDSPNINDFAYLTEEWNSERVVNLMKKLAVLFRGYNSEKFAIVLTGSDARRESGPSKSFQLVVLCNEKKVGNEISRKLFKNARHLSIEGETIEIKILGDDDSINYYERNHGNYWPCRILNTQLLFGSTSLLTKAREKIVSDFQHKKCLREDSRKNKRRFKKTTRDGKSKVESKQVEHFDQENGIINYQPDQYVRGLKYGPIRLLQYLLLEFQLNNLVINIDPNTVEKLIALIGYREDVILAYLEALKSYHYQLVLAEQGKSGILEVDPQFIKWITHTILSFADYH